MTRNLIICVLLLCCVVGGTGSCGYRFAGSGELPPDIQAMFIHLFENRSTETGIEVRLTDDLKNEFVQRYGGDLVKNEGSGATLTGSISEVKTWTVSRSGTLAPLERRVSMTVEARLTGKTGETLRPKARVTASETYAVVSGDKQASDQNKQDAIAALSKQIAEAVFLRLAGDF